MKRINARKCRSLVQSLTPFKGHGAIYARTIRQGYAVFSYGSHWPLHVFDGQTWYHNTEKRSVTTSRHFSQSNPFAPSFALTTAEIIALVAKLEATPCS